MKVFFQSLCVAIWYLNPPSETSSCIWQLSRTDNPAYTLISRLDRPPVLLSFFILDTTLSVTFHVNNRAQRYECLPWQTDWKCVMLSPHFAGFSCRLWVWPFGSKDYKLVRAWALTGLTNSGFGSIFNAHVAGLGQVWAWNLNFIRGLQFNSVISNPNPELNPPITLEFFWILYWICFIKSSCWQPVKLKYSDTFTSYISATWSKYWSIGSIIIE